MRTLVTGADGLLGANLVRVLQADGHEVRALVQPDSKASTLKGLDIDIAHADIVESADVDLDRALRGCDVVFHTAGIADQRAPASLTWRVNLDGTRRLLASSMRVGTSRFVHTGSASSFAFRTDTTPGDESGGFPPGYRGVAYMESKARASEHVLELNERGDIQGVVVTPTFMIGPFDERPSSGELICQFVNRRMKSVSPGGRNFAYVGDVARVMANVPERGRNGETYILGGENLSYLEFFSLVAEVAGIDPPRRVLPKGIVLAVGLAGSVAEALTKRPALLNRRFARLACLETYYDPGKAIRELGLVPTPTKTAIEESVDALRAYGHIT